MCRLGVRVRLIAAGIASVAALLSTRPGYAFDVACQGTTREECDANCVAQVQAVCDARAPGSTRCYVRYACSGTGSSYNGVATGACCTDGQIAADPHVRTLDGLFYDFHATGEFIAVSTDTFALQVRQRSWNGCASVAVAAAVMMEANRIAVYAHESPPLWIDGIPVEVPCVPERLSEDLSVEKVAISNCVRSMDLSDGSRVELNISDKLLIYNLVGPNEDRRATIAVRAGYLDISVWPGSENAASAVGLLGSLDGDPGNDLRTRDGRIMPQPITFEQLYQDFGESWRVAQEESLFDYDLGEDSDAFTDPAFPAAPCPSLADDERLAAEEACQSVGIENKDLLRACIFDVGVTGDEAFADSYVGGAEPRVTLSVLTDGVGAELESPTDGEVESQGPGKFDAPGGSGCTCRFPGRYPGHFGSLFLLLPALLRRMA